MLVLTLDMTDIAAHAAATDTVMKHFGQVGRLSFLLCFHKLLRNV